MSVSHDEARRIVRAVIDGYGGDFVINDHRTLTRGYGWVFFFTTRQFLETRDVRYLPLGASPMLVLRDSGEVHLLGTALAVETALREFEREHPELVE